eukprot:242480_1
MCSFKPDTTPLLEMLPPLTSQQDKSYSNKQHNPSNVLNYLNKNNMSNNCNTTTHYIKGNLNRINRAINNNYTQLNYNQLNNNYNKNYTPNPKQKSSREKFIEKCRVSDIERNKFQKFIQIIGYKMSTSKLKEFFDSKCKQSVLCWLCCVDINDSIIKIVKLNRKVTPYKCNHLCANGKHKSWRKKLTDNDGLYYEHNKSFKENMIKIRDIYQSSINIVLDNNNKNIRKRVNMNANSGPAAKKRKTNVCNKMDVHIEKLELENIIKVQRNEALKIDCICSMNEWFSVMSVLEINNNNLNRMYERIERQIGNCELLPIIEQIKGRYNNSMNGLKVKFDMFENEWKYWNKQQIIYWIKNIENCKFNNKKYLKFINEIEKNKLIRCGNDIGYFNNLSLFLLGVKNENDRNVIENNVNRLKMILN